MAIGVYSMHPGWVRTGGLTEALPRFTRVVGPLLRDPVAGRRHRRLAAGLAGRAARARAASGTTAGPGRLHRLPRTRESAAERDSAFAELVRRSGFDDSRAGASGDGGRAPDEQDRNRRGRGGGPGRGARARSRRTRRSPSTTRTRTPAATPTPSPSTIPGANLERRHRLHRLQRPQLPELRAPAGRARGGNQAGRDVALGLRRRGQVRVVLAPGGVFARPLHLADPRFHRMMSDLARFFREARGLRRRQRLRAFAGRVPRPGRVLALVRRPPAGAAGLGGLVR